MSETNSNAKTPFEASFVYNGFKGDKQVMQDLIAFFNVKDKTSDVGNASNNGEPFLGMWNGKNGFEVEIKFFFEDELSAMIFGYVFCQDAITTYDDYMPKERYVHYLKANNSQILNYINPDKYDKYVQIGQKSNNRAILDMLKKKNIDQELRDCLITHKTQSLEDAVNGILSLIKN